MDFEFDLGADVRDTISGFSGVIVSRAQWLYGCNTYGIRPRKLHEGKPLELQYFDEFQLEIASNQTEEPHREGGGPTQAVPQTNR